MAEQVRRKYTAKATRREQSQAEEVQSQKRESTPSKEETDALLDEIEGVLETNAEEFVRNYTQKGGE
jgi:ubiquitin-like protein Pup